MTTKHTHPMVFGKREAGCPRCAELDAGAPVIQQPWRGRAARIAAERSRAIENHNCEAHRCGPVCVAFDW